MKFLKIGFVAAAFALFAIACSQTTVINKDAPAVNVNDVSNAQAEVTPAAPTDDLASAGKIYKETCIGCHKADGAGGVTILDDGKKVKAPNFSSDRMKKEDDADWIETIENGAKEDGMPAFKGRLSDEEIRNLVKFIRKEFQQK